MIFDRVAERREEDAKRKKHQEKEWRNALLFQVRPVIFLNNPSKKLSMRLKSKLRLKNWSIREWG